MTAEVVIGNGFGVVVASDDATTSANRRTYEGANKIIGLPLPHSLAVLHTGRVLLHGVPFSTFVNNWITSLPPKSLNKVEDYVESFTTFVKDQIEDYSSSVEIARTYIADWQERVRDVYYWLYNSGSLDPESIKSHFKSQVESWGGDLTQNQRDFGSRVFALLGEGTRHNLLEDDCRSSGCPELDHSSIEGVIRHWFADETDEEGVTYALEWAKLFLSKFHPSTGRNIITFVGYGAKDFLPVCDSHDFEGVILDRLFQRGFRHAKAEWTQSGYVLFETFGQRDEITRFVREAGLDADYSSQIVADRVEKLKVASTPSAGQNQDMELDDSPSGKSPYETIASEIASGLSDATSRNEFETRSALAGMNLRTCASIAARLIHIQNLALDLRNELPTVGSEVQVAVITKANGFSFVDHVTGQPI